MSDFLIACLRKIKFYSYKVKFCTQSKFVVILKSILIVTNAYCLIKDFGRYKIEILRVIILLKRYRLFSNIMQNRELCVLNWGISQFKIGTKKSDAGFDSG